MRRWLAKHPRFVLHFIPTSSSWLNLVERWFEGLSEKAVRRGAFRSVADLERAIEELWQHGIPILLRLSGLPAWRASSKNS